MHNHVYKNKYSIRIGAISSIILHGIEIRNGRNSALRKCEIWILLFVVFKFRIFFLLFPTKCLE